MILHIVFKFSGNVSMNQTGIFRDKHSREQFLYQCTPGDGPIAPDPGSKWYHYISEPLPAHWVLPRSVSLPLNRDVLKDKMKMFFKRTEEK